MNLKRTLVLGSLAWVALISGLHAWLNLGLFQGKPGSSKALRVGYLPVT